MRDLERVQQSGYALEYVKQQTPELCLAAVQKDGYALEYVTQQTPEICLAAVQQNGYSIKYVRQLSGMLLLHNHAYLAIRNII